MAPPELTPLCSIDAEMGEMRVIGEGPAGLRVIAEVRTGALSGERLRGQMLSSSTADWIVINGGVGTVDVRATILTHDDAYIYVTYSGRIDMSEGPGTAPIVVAPTFETSDERYRWLNTVQAVGVGTLDGEQLHYDWFEVRPS